MTAEYKLVPTGVKGVYRLYERNHGWFLSRWCYVDGGTLAECTEKLQHLTKPVRYYDATGRRIKGG